MSSETEADVQKGKRHRNRFLKGGPEGNELLTAMTGGVLLTLISLVVLTLFDLQEFLSVHMFLGLVLIPPLLLKLISTGYRFIRYYTHARLR